MFKIDNFRPIAVKAINDTKAKVTNPETKPKNIYELAGAATLASANNITRNLSTKMGLLWERVASISPYAINTESEFGLKIKGIDLISLNISTGRVEYQQLKTKHDTLTGSQRERSVEELSIHEFLVSVVVLALVPGRSSIKIFLELRGKDFGLLLA
ncbi:hypothetical protein JCM19240_6570 [Vibrio maritimus]|uniref:Uncharacterized protein n=1 Tax=Vibrio maritimus TaxID=990268 RepID=A0A090T1U3_9VIBR|nr:hypothetical protein JCM19240_6570 [Vibrio maritimus]